MVRNHRQKKRSYNAGQNIWNKVKKLSKTEQDREEFDIYFWEFFSAVAKV